MKHILKGVWLSFIFAIVSALLAGAGGPLGLESWWWPVYWPALVFCIVGYPVVFLLDNVLLVNRIFSFIFPGGGASGVFGAIFLSSFLGWAAMLGLASKFNVLKTLTRLPSRPGAKNAPVG